MEVSIFEKQKKYRTTQRHGINYIKIVTHKWENEHDNKPKKQYDTQTDSAGEQVYYAGEHTLYVGQKKELKWHWVWKKLAMR